MSATPPIHEVLQGVYDPVTGALRTTATLAADNITVQTGGIYNTTPPVLTNGQQGEFQLDSNGNLKVSQATLISGEDLTNNWLVNAGKTTTIALTATSPASATTTAQTAVTGLGGYRTMTVYASLQGATGGTLDIYLQMSPDGGITWVDYAHYAQQAAAAAANTKVFTVTKSSQSAITVIGTGTTPALAVNTVVGGDWGDRLRVVFVAGAGTTAGAAQTILATLTT